METIEKLATEIQKEINNTMEVCLFLAEKMINEPEHKYNKKRPFNEQISIAYSMLMRGDLETEFLTRKNENRLSS